MNCPHCHQLLREGARFCDSCGLSVSSADLWAIPNSAPGPAEPPSSTDPLIGYTLESKYQLDERLGEGGMGAVYRARRIHIGDEVVVKILHQRYVADALAVERFRREARAAAMLNHPNVVTIHDFGEARGTEAPAFIVMELVRGVSLRKLLQQEGRLPMERAVSLMRAICAGVGAAHRKHIYHRDLKPDNIIVQPPNDDYEQETVKVVDFGIAKLRDNAGGTLTHTGVVMGTPYYMSPEQCRGESLDARSDVYSLGVILYEMLAGTPPFTAETFTGVITRHLYDEPPLLPVDLNIPHVLQAIFIRTLSKEPDMRQSDATVLGRELQLVEQRKREESDASTRLFIDEQRRQEEAEAQRRAEEEEVRRRAEEEEENRRRDTQERERRELEEHLRREAEERARKEEEERRRLLEDEQRRRLAAVSRPAVTDGEERRRLERDVARRIAEINAKVEQESRGTGEYQRHTGEHARRRTNDAWRAEATPEASPKHSSPLPLIIGFVVVLFIVGSIIALNSDSSSSNTNSNEYESSYNSSYSSTTTSNTSSSDSSAAASHYSQGRSYYDQRRYSDAEYEYREAVRLDPTNASYQNALGTALAGQRKYSDAEAAQREAIRLSPSTAVYHDNVGLDLHWQKRYSEAETEFREAVRLDSSNAQYHDHLANELNWQKRYSEAETEFREAIRLDPDNAQYHVDYGNNLTWQSRWADAKAEYRKALDIDPDNKEAREALKDMR